MEEFKIDKCCPLKINLVLGILALFLVVLAVSTVIDINDKLKETESVITVQGTGEVYAKPDLALTTFSVAVEAASVTEALTENTERMNTIIAAVKNEGVEEKDLKTTSFNIYPRYEWRNQTLYYPSGERVLVGYEVHQSLQVKIRDMGKVGVIIQAATESGANEVGSLQFTIEEQDELKSQAREEAISEAKEKAEELAFQLGVKLVGVSSFNESGYVPLYSVAERMEGIGGAGGGPTIETGENKIEVTVNITYKIR